MVKQLLFFFMLTCVSYAHAQEDGAYYVSRDLSTWTTAKFDLGITKAWSFSIAEQLRLKTNSSELDAFFTELETKYKFKKGFGIGIGYRVIGDKTNNSGVIDWEQRFQGDLSYEFKVKRFDFDVRLRGQSKDDLGEKKEDGDYARRALRLKFETKYDIKKWKFDPEISTEIFLESGKYVKANFSTIRATIGTSYNFKKAGELSMFYRFEKDINTDYPLSHNIIGLQYKFAYKVYKNGKEK